MTDFDEYIRQGDKVEKPNLANGYRFAAGFKFQEPFIINNS
jgi:hypothetical protein